MDLTGMARGAVASAVGAATRVLPGARTGSGGAQQTLTVARPAEEVLAALRDPDVLSRLLGDLGRVALEAPGRYGWTLTAGGAEHRWTAVLAEAGDGLRYTGEDRSPTTVEVSTATAPQGQGTEVRLVLDVPAPDLAAGAVAFTLLYRLRALLQTGEVPTLGPPMTRPTSAG